MATIKKPTYVLGSTKWWKNQKHNLFSNILKLALYILIFMAIWYMIAPLLGFIGIYNWWRAQKQLVNSVQIKDCFSFANLAYWQDFPLYAKIGKLITPSVTSFADEAQAGILMFLIKNFANGIVPGGSLTGIALCQTIVPQWKPPQALVTQYNKCKQVELPEWKTPIEWPGYDPQGLDMWRKIIYIWGGMGGCGKKGGGCGDDATSLPGSAIPCTKTPPGKSCGKEYTWMSSGEENNGNNQQWLGNFLWQGYQIPFNSAMIITFLTKNANICNTGVRGSDQVFPILIGSPLFMGSAQGWWGAIKYISSELENTTLADLHEFFWEGVSIEKAGGTGAGNPNAPKNCSSGDVTSSVATGVGAASGIGMAVIPAACSGPAIEASYGISCLLGIGVTAATGTASATGAASKAGCCNVPWGAPPCCKKVKGGARSCVKGPAKTTSGGGCTIS